MITAKEAKELLIKTRKRSERKQQLEDLARKEDIKQKTRLYIRSREYKDDLDYVQERIEEAIRECENKCSVKCISSPTYSPLSPLGKWYESGTEYKLQALAVHLRRAGYDAVVAMWTSFYFSLDITW